MRQIRQPSRLICGCTENLEKPTLRTIYASSVLFLSEDQVVPSKAKRDLVEVVYTILVRTQDQGVDLGQVLCNDLRQ
ncbi:hypothetical protein M0804_007516 [Polistes exclamans]|nr:hypothetical protein M0804_007516 [Polistes exclamans]